MPAKYYKMDEIPDGYADKLDKAIQDGRIRGFMVPEVWWLDFEDHIYIRWLYALGGRMCICRYIFGMMC